MTNTLDILKLSNKQEIEKATASLDLGQIHELITHLQMNKAQVEKFHPILLGMDQGVFYQFLETLSIDEDCFLKEYGLTEPLFHKLSILAHDWKQDLESIVKAVYEIASRIEAINLSQITKQEIFTIKKSIDDFDQSIEKHLQILNYSLSIAWNSKRVDLIDNLSTLKDLFMRAGFLLVGHVKIDDQPATGLYKKLEDRLNQVYSYNSRPSLEPLNDQDSAIEALTSFGIFYLEDYVFLGLLPEIPTLVDLKNVLKEKNTNELHTFLASAIVKVEESLKAIGLNNVKAFKEAKIYSKDILREYIQANKLKVK